MGISGNLRDIAKPSVIITLQKAVADEIAARIAADIALGENIADVDSSLSAAIDTVNNNLLAAISDLHDVLAEKNSSPIVWADEMPLYGATFVDLIGGEPVIHDDGTGDYLIHVTTLNEPYLRYLGRIVTDNVTGIEYLPIVENGEAILEQVV